MTWSFSRRGRRCSTVMPEGPPAPPRRAVLTLLQVPVKIRGCTHNSLRILQSCCDHVSTKLLLSFPAQRTLWSHLPRRTGTTKLNRTNGIPCCRLHRHVRPAAFIIRPCTLSPDCLFMVHCPFTCDVLKCCSAQILAGHSSECPEQKVFKKKNGKKQVWEGREGNKWKKRKQRKNMKTRQKQRQQTRKTEIKRTEGVVDEKKE